MAQAAYNIATNGDPASIIINVLGGIGDLGSLGTINATELGLTGSGIFSQATTLAEYAAVGAAFGSAAESFGDANIIQGFSSLIQEIAGTSYGQTLISGAETLTSNLVTDVESMIEGFIANELVGTVVAGNTLNVGQQIEISLGYDSPVTLSGFVIMDTALPVSIDSNAIVATVNGYETAPNQPINQLYVLANGVGVGAYSGLTVADGDDLNQLSAAVAYTDMIDNGVNATTAQSIENILAPVALGSSSDPNGALYGTALETWFTNPANASIIQTFDTNFTQQDAQILGAAVVATNIQWCADNIYDFEGLGTDTQGQLTELRVNGDLIYTTTPGNLSTLNGTKQQLFYDIDAYNWGAVQTDLQTLEQFTGNKALLAIASKLVNDNGTHL